MNDKVYYYSATMLPEKVNCQRIRIKSRWLRRTLGYQCVECGRWSDKPQACPIGTQNAVASAAGYSFEQVVRRMLENGYTAHTIPWGKIKAQRDYDLTFARDRLIASVAVPGD